MATTTSAATRAPLGSVSDNTTSSNKRSAEDAKPAATLAPYAQRMKELEEARANAGSDKILMFSGRDILEAIPGKMEELEVEEVEELDEDVKQAAYNSLTQAQVDKHLQVMVVDRKLCQLQREFYKNIMFADPRNDEEDGMVCLNTYSSWCMYPVIQKLLTAATKEVNKAKRAIESGTTQTKNIAVEALNKAYATILACDAMDHWKLDTESPEDCEKVAKKVSKIASDLLWFDDEELGFVESHSRRAMLNKLESVNKDWNDIGGVKYKTKNNGQGLGRSHAPPPAAKKQKTAAVVLATTIAPGSNNESLVSFLNAISDKKKLREKTCVQLKIQSVAKPEKSALVVISGATDMKKVNQLCAYVTGKAQGFEYHSQRGTCMKGSRIELSLEESKLWLAAKSLSKQAASAGAAHVEDKKIKIIQVFQGLNTSATSGVVYDSNDSRNVKAYWVTAEGERYEISVQAIIANKCLGGKLEPMPRLVKHLDGYTPNVRTGFGKGVYAANRHLQGDRSGPKYIFFAGTSAADVKKTHDSCMSKPIANEDGSVRYDAWGESYFWKAENVASAGPPSA